MGFIGIFAGALLTHQFTSKREEQKYSYEVFQNFISPVLLQVCSFINHNALNPDEDDETKNHFGMNETYFFSKIMIPHIEGNLKYCNSELIAALQSLRNTEYLHTFFISEGLDEYSEDYDTETLFCKIVMVYIFLEYSTKIIIKNEKNLGRFLLNDILKYKLIFSLIGAIVKIKRLDNLEEAWTLLNWENGKCDKPGYALYTSVLKQYIPFNDSSEYSVEFLRQAVGICYEQDEATNFLSSIFDESDEIEDELLLEKVQ